MISSTRADLDQYRREASRIIKSVADEKRNRVQLLEISMERETQTGNREFAVEVSKGWVEESDWLILIVGWHYGTISDEPGANGLSVTEWEYRHARTFPEKKIFAFVAGAPDTSHQYRYADGEEKDLKDWIAKQTPDQRDKLEDFKKELTKPHAEMFANLKMFRERLDLTLKSAIDELPPDIQPGTPLAELVVAVVPAIRACIRKVNLVANCKEIHDQLHELRQHVIRPLREEVLPVWKQEGTLSDSRRSVIWRRIVKKATHIGAISQARKSVDPEHQGLRDSVDAVLASPELWPVDADADGPEPTLERFTESVETFADAVQQAFSEADRSMTQSEADLREHYLALQGALHRGRHTMPLGSGDQRRLDEELQTLDSHRIRVKNTLTMHHCWQEAHDKLEEVGGFRDADSFERKLKQYRATSVPRLLGLVEQEVAEQEVALVNEAAAPGRQRLLQPLTQLLAAIKVLQADASVHAFDEMRKPFDDAFYVVDHRTMNEVAHARERVVGIEQWLDGLAAAEREVV
jgi:uncharacterized protein DUF4062